MRKSFIQLAKGRYPRQAHVDLDGLKDDEISRLGFDGRASQLYRRNDPTQFRATGDFRVRYAPVHALPISDGQDASGAPIKMLHNQDGAVYLSTRNEAPPFFERNVNGDQLFFIHKGSGTFETEFGPLAYRPGDYIGMPKSITYRQVPDAPGGVFLILETAGNLEFPDFGVFGRQSPLDATLIETPEPKCVEGEPGVEYEIRVTHGDEHSSLFQDFHPFDVEGWKGDLFPYRFNMEDWNVILSDTVHLPPPVSRFHQAPGIDVIHFLPRPAEGKQGAERAPWYHRNADYDEINFFHGGDFMGQPMPEGLLMHTPQGIHHGIAEKVREMTRAEWEPHARIGWKIISIDSARPMTPTAAYKAFDK
ncbi:MAG: homogentisate 1,2-dioxygenase [Pseudomonadota bacterium]